MFYKQKDLSYYLLINMFPLELIGIAIVKVDFCDIFINRFACDFLDIIDFSDCMK